MRMQYRVCETDVEVMGYDEYVKDFEEHALPEFKGEAENMLLDALEREDRGDVVVRLEAEKTVKKVNVEFRFFFNEGSPAMQIDYSSSIES